MDDCKCGGTLKTCKKCGTTVCVEKTDLEKDLIQYAVARVKLDTHCQAGNPRAIMNTRCPKCLSRLEA